MDIYIYLIYHIYIYVYIIRISYTHLYLHLYYTVNPYILTKHLATGNKQSSSAAATAALKYRAISLSFSSSRAPQNDTGTCCQMLPCSELGVYCFESHAKFAKPTEPSKTLNTVL